MREEQQMLLQALISTRAPQNHGQRSYHRGRLHGREVVMVLSGIGKVAAACTATSLITEFGCDTLLFTGTAGSLDENVKVGDIVVSGELLQHDLDASPLFPRFEVPLTGKSRFKADARWTTRLVDAARTAVGETLLSAAGHARLQALGIGTPQVHQGLLVSGDRFFNHGDQVRQLREVLPDALAVDMESAAVAQVCADYRVPFSAVRSISDWADAQSHIDFDRFNIQVARHYSAEVLRHALQLF